MERRGGRTSGLAQAKAHSAAFDWEPRWTLMLGTTCAVAFAESLVAPKHVVSDRGSDAVSCRAPS